MFTLWVRAGRRRGHIQLQARCTVPGRPVKACWVWDPRSSVFFAALVNGRGETQGNMCSRSAISISGAVSLHEVSCRLARSPYLPRENDRTKKYFPNARPQWYVPSINSKCCTHIWSSNTPRPPQGPCRGKEASAVVSATRCLEATYWTAYGVTIHSPERPSPLVEH